jgi:hypothetical protein
LVLASLRSAREARRVCPLRLSVSWLLFSSFQTHRGIPLRRVAAACSPTTSSSGPKPTADHEPLVTGH